VLDQLLEHLAAHEPADPAEAESLRRIRTLVRWLPSPLDEHADPTHVTGSAIVLDDDGRVLLHRHKRLGIWLQPGGHVDAGEQPWEGARRETLEETGADASHPAGSPRLIHVDVHEGPRGHVHLDLRYLLRADGGAPLRPAAGESPHVSWFEAEEASLLGDGSLAAAIASACRWHEHARRGSLAGTPGC
jgi:8-oxo-dGTP pyrophosphatase MutT (NUDIX family)